MIIYFISDTHLGYKERDTEIEYDSYYNLNNALEIANKDADLIVMPGDIFDIEIPTQETFDRTFKLLSKYIENQKITPIGKENTLTKIPIIIVPGNHEQKGQNNKGPIDILESANYIYQLQKNFIHFDYEDERIVIYGMKGVPDKIAKNLLEKLNYRPVDNATNILVTHQSFKEFLPFDDDMIATLTIADLPKGFDLYVNGHLHLSNQIKLSDKSTFLLPGSTIYTQIKKQELTRKKGIFRYDTKTKDIEFIEIPNQRDFYLIEISVESEDLDKVREKINAKIDELETIPKNAKIFDKDIILKPIIKIKIRGKLKSGNSKSELKENYFQREDKIIILDKKLEISELKEKIKEIDIIKDRNDTLLKGNEIFQNNLKDAGFKDSFKTQDLLEFLNKDIEKITNSLIESIDINEKEEKQINELKEIYSLEDKQRKEEINKKKIVDFFK